jgi:hypothetical protein
VQVVLLETVTPVPLVSSMPVVLGEEPVEPEIFRAQVRQARVEWARSRQSMALPPNAAEVAEVDMAAQPAVVARVVWCRQDLRGQQTRVAAVVPEFLPVRPRKRAARVL